jgi:ABC-2 type transport system permease protein
VKLLTTIGKNLKLLFRSKESAYTIIFGPILIILLVSFAFVGAGDKYTVNVGTFAPAQTGFSAHTTQALGEKHYLLRSYSDEASCIDSVRAGANHACLSFSAAEAGNGTIPVTIYLDMSRANIAYRIADDLESTLDTQSGAIRAHLTDDVLTRMSMASILVERDINLSRNISARLDAVADEVATARQDLALLAQNTSINASDARMLRGYQLGLAQNTRTVLNMSTAAIDRASLMVARIDSECTDCGDATKNEVKQLRKDLDDAETKMTLVYQDTAQKQLQDANIILSHVVDDIEGVQRQLQNDSAARQRIASSVARISLATGRDAQDMRQLTSNLEQADALLKGEKRNASAISTPVETSVVSITPDDKLGSAYPYVLVLVIMFIGMLLASSLIVADKTSKASFRNFTTPTSDGYHIAAAFITAALLLAAEVMVILLLSSLFVPLSFTSSSTIFLLLIAIVLFTFIGMIIGYLSRTQEAAMIASISVGSISLFISNLILPVEGMAAAVQQLGRFNPYLVLSELLKKSMLYGVSIAQVSREVLLLGIMCLVLLGVTLLIQRRIKRRYFKQDGGMLAPHIPAPLHLGQHQVHNEVELLDTLDRMTRTEFEAIVRSEDNVISQWTRVELRNKALAKRLRTTSKERMMLRLDEHLEKHGKRITSTAAE